MDPSRLAKASMRLMAMLTLAISLAAPVQSVEPVEYRAQGTWTSSKSAEPGTWKGVLYRSATSDSLSGKISVDGATVIADALVIGSMSADSVTFGLVQGDVAVAKFTGSTAGATMQGTYSFEPMNDSGSWEGSLTKVEQ